MGMERSSEEWLPIPGLSGYEASSLGRIRSVDRVVSTIGRWGTPRSYHYKGKVLRLGMGGSRGLPYLIFTAGKNGPQRVNRAVCSAFKGLPPSQKHEAAHLNGCSLDNCETNLKWSTPIENWTHRFLHGTASVGVANSFSKLTEDDVLAVFTRFAAGESLDAISSDLGTIPRNLRKIISREIWKHVPVPYPLIRACGVRTGRLLELA